MKSRGIYIYAIVPVTNAPEMILSPERSGVYAVSFENISAIVSDTNEDPSDLSENESYRHQRAKHHKILEELYWNGFKDLIPVRTGTIVKSKDDVIKIIENGQSLISDTLKKVRVMTEIRLAVTRTYFSATLRDIILDPEVIAFNDKMFTNRESFSKDEQLKAGSLVREKLRERNAKVELNILESLSPVSRDLKLHDVLSDQMITNTSFLIEKDNQEAFIRIIDQIEEEYNGTLTFKIEGPLPCYSFFTIEVGQLNLKEVAKANCELGLQHEISESEITKAYLSRTKQIYPDAEAGNCDAECFNRITKAYHTLLDYSAASKQLPEEKKMIAGKRKLKKKMMLVKISD